MNGKPIQGHQHNNDDGACVHIIQKQVRNHNQEKVGFMEILLVGEIDLGKEMFSNGRDGTCEQDRARYV